MLCLQKIFVTLCNLGISCFFQCNQSCGGGVQFREAYCVMQAENTTIPSNKCTNKMKGLLERPCSTHQCPKWHTGAWPVGVSHDLSVINIYTLE